MSAPVPSSRDQVPVEWRLTRHRGARWLAVSRTLPVLSVLVLGSLPHKSWAARAALPEQSITLVQLGDAHIFDDGWDLPVDEAVQDTQRYASRSRGDSK